MRAAIIAMALVAVGSASAAPAASADPTGARAFLNGIYAHYPPWIHMIEATLYL